MASVEQVQGSETTAEEVVNKVVEEGARLGVKRFFTIPGRDPFDEIEWETRDAIIPGRDGPAFEQRGVEFPKFWSQTATNIVAQKYFRGRMGSPDRERSVKQMIGRVVDTATEWGRTGGYFVDENTVMPRSLVTELQSAGIPLPTNVVKGYSGADAVTLAANNGNPTGRAGYITFNTAAYDPGGVIAITSRDP